VDTFPLPTSEREIRKIALDLIEECRHTAGIRASYARVINQIIETGKQDGGKSLMNLLYMHMDRFAAHLYSPTDLRFVIDFENEYPEAILDRGKVAARLLTRTWERNNTDIVFGTGVFEAGKYGACVLKQWVTQDGPERKPRYNRRLVMPWQFGVWREDENEISNQTVLCETTLLTMPEVWQRIYDMEGAQNLFHKIQKASAKEQASEVNQSFFHQVLSSSTLQTTSPAIPRPGGIVNFGNDPNYAIMQPEVITPMAKLHELWVQDEGDYTTIQLIEPDILIEPRGKKRNLLIDGEHHTHLHPYTLIQPNVVAGYFWGRPEIVDLIEPQTFLSTTADDVRRLFGLQVDKIIGLVGFDGLTDEIYDQQRAAGYISAPPGAVINDITPEFPPQAIPLIQELVQIVNMIGGFPPIMQGQGEAGVRAGVHANTLMKTGSPTLRDRSLLVERQCAVAADLTLTLKEAKDDSNFWTKGKNIEEMHKTSFKLTDLPHDWRVAVDSHSSSPIFQDDHAQLIAFGVKAGFIDGHSAIDMLPFPQKELLHARLTKKEEEQAALMKQHPELLAQLLKRGSGGGRMR
jgi:hypothetical protein